MMEPEDAVLLALDPEWMATIRRNIHSRYSHVDGEIDAWELGLVERMADSLLLELDAQLIEARELRVRLAAVEQERDALAIAREVVAARLAGLSLLDFGGLVACGANRAKAEALLLNLLFPETP